MSWHFSKALIQDYENLRYSPGRVGAYSEANCLDGELFAPWKSMPFAPDDSCSAKMKDTCHRSPYGMMYVPSTDESGKAVLMWFREGFRAKPFQRPAMENIQRNICGTKCLRLLEMSNPVLFSPKTWTKVQSSVLKTTLPLVDTKRFVACYRQDNWAQIILGEDGGWLPTPTTKANWGAKSMQKWPSSRRAVRVFGKPDPEIHEYLMGWPAGWTDSTPLATAKFQQWLDSHGRF